MKQERPSQDTKFSTTDMVTRRQETEGAPATVSCLQGGTRLRGLGKASVPGKPLISIIIVVLNRVAVLGNALRSVISQSYDNVELIVVDGASNDGSVDLLREHDPDIDIWVSEPDAGLYHAMNRGIELASGDWLFFLGSDDVMLDCLTKVAQYLSDASTVYYGDVYLSTAHRLSSGPVTPYRLMRNNIPHQATFYPRSLFQGYRYNTDYLTSADYDLNLRCFNDPRFSYRYMPVLVSIYEDTSGISTLRLDKRFELDFPRILKENFPPRAYRNYLMRGALKNFDRLVIRKMSSLFKKKRPKSR